MKEILLKQRSQLAQSVLGELLVNSGWEVAVLPADRKEKTAKKMEKSPAPDDDVSIVFFHEDGRVEDWRKAQEVTWESVEETLPRLVEWIRVQDEVGRESGETGRFKVAYKEELPKSPSAALEKFLELAGTDGEGFRAILATVKDGEGPKLQAGDTVIVVNTTGDDLSPELQAQLDQAGQSLHVKLTKK